MLYFFLGMMIRSLMEGQGVSITHYLSLPSSVPVAQTYGHSSHLLMDIGVASSFGLLGLKLL